MCIENYLYIPDSGGKYNNIIYGVYGAKDVVVSEVVVDTLLKKKKPQSIPCIRESIFSPYR